MLLSLLIGGGTAPSLPTDAVIEIATIVVCVGVLSTKRSTQIDARAFVFPLLAMAAVIAQLIPLPVDWVEPFWPAPVRAAWSVAGGDGAFGFLTLNVASTIAGLAILASASLLMWTLASLAGWQLRGVLVFVAIGVLANVFAGAIQMSVNRFGPVNHVLPYTIWAGFFANPNHFATLLTMTIPPLSILVGGPRRWAAMAALGVVLLLILAAGSIAGVMIGFSVAVVSVLTLGGRPVANLAAAPPAPLGGTAGKLTTVAFFGAFAAAAFYNVTLKAGNMNAVRPEIWRTSVAALRESPFLGTGFDAFQQSYQIYERAQDISAEYVNHAHNDYIELLMGGGAVAGIVIAIYFALFVWRAWERRHNRAALAAAFSILCVLIHSAVDYPLRTMAILYLFVYAHAVLFSADDLEPPPPPPPVRRSPRPNPRPVAVERRT